MPIPEILNLLPGAFLIGSVFCFVASIFLGSLAVDPPEGIAGDLVKLSFLGAVGTFAGLMLLGVWLAA